MLIIPVATPTMRPNKVADETLNPRLLAHYLLTNSCRIATAKKATPAKSRLPVKSQTTTAAMMGNMKWITAASTIIKITPMITNTAKMINSPDVNEGINNSRVNSVHF